MKKLFSKLLDSFQGFPLRKIVLFLILIFIGVYFLLPKSLKKDLTLMPDDGMPYYFQIDPQYQENWYGEGTLAQTGCGPTSLAMALSFLIGQPISPVEIANYAAENGYYVEGVGTAWALFSDYPSLYGIEAWQCVLEEKEVAQALAQGNIIIFSMGPGDFTNAGHIIVAKNLTEQNGTNVHDPNSKENSKVWNISTLLSQAKGAFILQNP